MQGYKFGFGSAYKPHVDGAAVTPSDSVDLEYWATSLWVGTGGDVSLVTPYGTTLLFGSVPSGTLLPFAAKRVNATDTTASGIVAGY
jgi:hypothetical protein